MDVHVAGAQRIDPMRDLSFPDTNVLRHLESGDFYLIINNQKVKFELED